MPDRDHAAGPTEVPAEAWTAAGAGVYYLNKESLQHNGTSATAPECYPTSGWSIISN